MAAETIRGKVDHDKDIHEVPKYHSTDYCENTWEGKHILTMGTIGSHHLNQVIKFSIINGGQPAT